MKRSIVESMKKEMGIGQQEAKLRVNKLAGVLEDFNWQEVGGSKGRG